MMHKIIIILLAVFMSTSVYIGGAEAAADEKPFVKTPYAAQIAPNMGLLKVREQVKLKKIGPNMYSFAIYLPASTSVQAGFDVYVKGFSLNSINRKLLLPEDDPAGSPRAEILGKLKAARQEQARLQGLKQSLDTRLSLWSRQPDKNYENLPSAKDLEALDTAIGVKMPGVYAELSVLPEKMQKAAEEIKYFENELRALGGEKTQLSEITVTVAGQLEEGQSVMAEYSYFSYDCGWYPSYSFDANPLKGEIIFRQQANIVQRSGRDWNGVELSLATKAPDLQLRPHDLLAWNLYRQDDRAVSNMAMKSQMSARSYEEVQAEGVEFAAPASPRPAAISLELGTHREWQIGQVNLSSKTPSSLELESKNWNGDFYYTLRPSLEEAAYLTAKVELSSPVELSPGEAIFMVDGRLAGYIDNFKAGGKELDLFFGKDDMVSVEVQDLISQKGEERFILKTNTYNWHWKFIVKNKRNREVKVRVEDPSPEARDASIKLKVQSSPEAKKDYRAYYWEEKIPATSEFIIEHKVEARASGSERIIPGR